MVCLCWFCDYCIIFSGLISYIYRHSLGLPNWHWLSINEATLKVIDKTIATKWFNKTNCVSCVCFFGCTVIDIFSISIRYRWLSNGVTSGLHWAINIVWYVEVMTWKWRALSEESTGRWWIHLSKDSNAEVASFRRSYHKKMFNKQSIFGNFGRHDAQVRHLL